ncbi:hypothetical protein BH24BAC1_BH24BAC1_00500 [soil metagenome]
MKKIFFFAAFLALGAGGAQAQTLGEPSDSVVVEETPVVLGPQITFQELKKDFGKIRQGEVIEHLFVFENTGNLPLILSEVKTTCGCTATEWPRDPIAPGERGTIKARFDSAGKTGAQQKVISVVSNSLSGKAYLSLITQIQPRLASN